MTDSASAGTPSPRRPGLLRLLFHFLAGDSLLVRVVVLGMLTLALLIPLNMIGGVIADRRAFESEATKSVTDAWGGAQTFAGPMIVLPYRRPSDGRQPTCIMTLLPDKLSIDGRIQPEQRRLLCRPYGPPDQC